MTTEYTPNFNLALPDFRMGPWHDLLNDDLTRLDQLLYGVMSKVDTPPWANATHYPVGVTAFDSQDGSTWMCAIDHTSSATGLFADDRAAHPTYWAQLLTGFAPRGEWTNNTQYFPYDLVYSSSQGIIALCKVRHTSNPTGSIKDDSTFWSFLADFSTVTSPTANMIPCTFTSPLTKTNVQAELDEIGSMILSLNNVNVTQGNQITTLQNQDSSDATRMTNIEAKNTTQDTLLTGLRTDLTTLQNQVNAMPPPFPSGTKMPFYQSVPPTGWTIVAGLTDRGIRIVSDASGGTGGGSVGFNTVFARTATDSHVLGLAEIPSHSHPQSGYFVVSGGAGTWSNVATTFDLGTGNTGAVGGGAGHTHPMDLRLQYVNMCIGQKT